MEISPKVSTRPIVLFVALLSAVALALVAFYTLGIQAAAPTAGHTTFHLQGIGAEQIGHNRSEEGLGSVPAGGEQVNHNRSEEGLTP